MLDRDKLADLFLEKAQELTYDTSQWHEKKGEYSVDFETIVNGYVVRVQILPQQWLKEAEVDVIKMTSRKPSPRETLFRYWIDTHFRMLGHPYGKYLTKQERGMLDNVLKEYDLDYTEAMVRYFFKHFESLPKYTGAPTVHGFVGYRKTIALKMEDKRSKPKVRDEGSL